MGSTLRRKDITGHDPVCERPPWSNVEAHECSQCAQIALIRERLIDQLTLEASRQGLSTDETVSLGWVVAVILRQTDTAMTQSSEAPAPSNA